jgi:hypothetical protein
MIMNVFKSNKASLGALLLALVVLTMLAACSSSDEAAQEDPGASSGNSDCENACQLAPPHQLDECMLAC